MQTKTKGLLLGGGLLLAAAITFGSVVWGGVVTVAGTDPHYAPVQWTLKTTMRSSVRHHAADIEVPAGIDLHDPGLAEYAFGHYSVACTPCHGAPGVDAAPWLVLNPPAEPLVDTAEQWSDAELYWIVKHGIKMTGMPALGPTHSEEDLWAIAAFVRQLPEMSPAEYEAMAQRHAGHGHASGSMAPTDPPTDPLAKPSPEPPPTTELDVIGACDTPGGAPSAEVDAPRVPTEARGRRAKVRRARPSASTKTAPTPSAEPSRPAATPAAGGHHHHGGSHG